MATALQRAGIKRHEGGHMIGAPISAVGGHQTIRVRIPSPSLRFTSVSHDGCSLRLLVQKRRLHDVRLTENEVKRVLGGRLALQGDVKWERSRTHPDFVIAELKVSHEQDGELIVQLTMNVTLHRKFTYNLRYRGDVVKSLHVGHRGHKNRVRDLKRFKPRETHKHVFLDECGTQWAYAPDDITTDEPHAAFLQFCEECGMTFDGNWSVPPTPPRGTADTPLGFERP